MKKTVEKLFLDFIKRRLCMNVSYLSDEDKKGILEWIDEEYPKEKGFNKLKSLLKGEPPENKKAKNYRDLTNALLELTPEQLSQPILIYASGNVTQGIELCFSEGNQVREIFLKTNC